MLMQYGEKTLETNTALSFALPCINLSTMLLMLFFCIVLAEVLYFMKTLRQSKLSANEQKLLWSVKLISDINQ